MATLAYLVTGDAPRAQQELSYSVLSALKSGLEGVEILLLCDAANRRPDLPVTPVDVPPRQLSDWTLTGRAPALARLHALAHLLDQTGAPVCVMATDTAFTSSPRALIERCGPGQILLQDRDGWVSTRPDWATWVDACQDSQFAITDQGAEVFDTGVIGASPAQIDIINHAINLAYKVDNSDPLDDIEQFCLSAALQANRDNIRFAADLVTRYRGYMRHVYHGRFDVMFPPGAPVNTALAQRLPAITEPPAPTLLRLKAKAYALRHGLGRGTAFGYLAYLCAFAAPTNEGRDVWANIALDMLQHSSRAPEKLQQDFKKLAPAALPEAALKPATQARWQQYWQDVLD
ncbi:hypothetical protein [Phaeobacter sp. HF9A]|uniref:hypothetical protein n=1 Tax=Phaeobacter sp. HF9A TaxID=2721561 RepID=UPI0014321FC9|nr:hypothetical protein [Phaeobacter sp. HF9A]NIZ13632.1 hypothetical protein [Phaeobacter sp. HF9A]